MNIITGLLTLLSLFLIYATFISLVRSDYWWIRVFDFPRLQILGLLVLTLAATLFYYDDFMPAHYLVTGLLLVSLFYQSYKIFKYTPLAPKEVLSYAGSESERTFSLIVSNVYQPNREVNRLIGHVKRYNPDLLLILEADAWWENQLKTIETDYPFTIRKPQDNLYGMLLYSKLKLEDSKIRFLINNDIPSFETTVYLGESGRFKFYCLHPRPPFPSESDTAANRDAELLVVGKDIPNHDVPVLIAGDFNDVAWSNTTRLFQKVSRLLDPRIGRGFYNSFHARYPLLRWSLDHVFHSDHFQLVELKRLAHIGSDHFPIYIKLHYKPEEQEKQEEPEADREELELAEEKIEKVL